MKTNYNKKAKQLILSGHLVHFETVNKFDGSYFIDSAHLTTKGYDILANQIVNLIKN